MADYEFIKYTLEDGLATVSLNQPDRLNALNGQMKDELLSVFQKLAQPSTGARALLITGEGRGFCAGADLAAGIGSSGIADPGVDLIENYHPFLLELAHLDMPVVSAINGVAAGAGMSIALSADLVIASKSAYFLQAFINIGLIPDAGSTFMLPRLIGNARARQLMMLGEKLPAEAALDWGLINEVVEDDDLVSHATALAKKLAAGPTRGYAHIRSLMRQSMNNSYAEQIQAEAISQRELGRSADFAEGVQAFIQKRPAEFKGE